MFFIKINTIYVNFRVILTYTMLILTNEHGLQRKWKMAFPLMTPNLSISIDMSMRNNNLKGPYVVYCMERANQ